MTNFELMAKLINLVGEDQKQNEILKQAVIALVDIEKGSASDPKPEAKKKAAATQQKEKPKRKTSIDWGKAGACRKAGWDYHKIADELGCSYSAVYNHFNEERKS